MFQQPKYTGTTKGERTQLNKGDYTFLPLPLEELFLFLLLLPCIVAPFLSKESLTLAPRGFKSGEAVEGEQEALEDLLNLEEGKGDAKLASEVARAVYTA
jgi:hypothetical protein